MHALVTNDKALLVQLLNACESQHPSISAVRFRADHHEAIDDIDRLVLLGYVKVQSQFYRVSLTALVQLETDTSRKILSQCETIWQCMRSHYKEQLVKPLATKELATKCGLEPATISHALSYMFDAPWYSGIVGTIDSEFEAVGAGEAVLKYEKFVDFIQEMRTWQSSNILKNASWGLPSSGTGKPVPESTTRRQKFADWIEDSPTKKIAVWVLGIFVGILGFGQLALNLYKDVQQARLTVTLAIKERTTAPLYAAVSMEQVLRSKTHVVGGSGTASKQSTMPYFPITALFSNPTTKKSTLTNCVLRIRFYERDGEFESIGDLTEELIKSGAVEAPNATSLDSGAKQYIAWAFFFLPEPKLQALLNDKTTQAHRFQLVCRDESNKEVTSEWH